MDQHACSFDVSPAPFLRLLTVAVPEILPSSLLAGPKHLQSLLDGGTVPLATLVPTCPNQFSHCIPTPAHFCLQTPFHLSYSQHIRSLAGLTSSLLGSFLSAAHQAGLPPSACSLNLQLVSRLHSSVCPGVLYPPPLYYPNSVSPRSCLSYFNA
jgi:hypothetical protein